MTVILFLLILGVLVFVHELGHFSVAKFFGIRVDEFGMGFPPRAKKLFSRNGTDYTLNWIPFGGFVKIYGEDSLENGSADPDYHRSMGAKPWWQQILVLIAGVTMNLILAWVLFSSALMVGAPTAVSGVANHDQVTDKKLTILSVVPGSPAETAGMVAGDTVILIESLDTVLTGDNITTEKFTDTIRKTPEATPVHIQVQKGTDPARDLLIIPSRSGEYPVIGVSLDQVGFYREGFFQALRTGFMNTVSITTQTVHAFWQLITGKTGTENLMGPVGLVSVVGDAQKIGAVYVIMLTAMISVNLAVLNLIPFPALDGGRVVIVLIEAITRRKIKPVVVQWINGVGFMLLLALMVFVTVKDVIKLF